MIEVSEIKTIQVESYIDTLRDIPVGANRVYLLIGTVYTVFIMLKPDCQNKTCNLCLGGLVKRINNFLR